MHVKSAIFWLSPRTTEYMFYPKPCPAELRNISGLFGVVSMTPE